MDDRPTMPPTAAALARMPLAEAAQWLLRWASDDRRLQSIWQRHRGRAYERVISFATLTRLVAEALVHHRGSGRRAFEKNIHADRLDASVTAAFGKLGRLPLAVSQAFLEETTAALAEIVVPAGAQPAPASLRDFHTLVLDGKTIKYVAKRLKPLRSVSGGLIGGKAVVALDGGTGLAVAMEANPDGDGAENLLVPGLLARVRRRVPGPRLYIADRQFGNLVQAEQFTAEGDHFLTRLPARCTFTADPDQPAVTSRDADGRTLTDTWGLLGSAGNRRRRPLRRIVLDRGPDDDPIVVVTDLTDAVAYPAADLLAAYRERQGIERVFQQTTEIFGLQHLIGGSPHAGLFQFAFCLLLYNLVRTLLGYVAEAHDVSPDQVSAEKLFDDTRRELIAWHVLLTPTQTQTHFQAVPERVTLMGHLRHLLAGVWCPTWTKAKPQPNRHVPHRSHTRSHASVYRILRAAAGKDPPEKSTTC
jgi:hypothetical protein